jgi:hypothetical protein
VVNNVAANDVTASIRLLLRTESIPDVNLLRCPGVSRSVRGGIGYSYAAPFGATDEFRLTDTMKSDFAIMADLNPGVSTSVPYRASLLEYRAVNSRSHGGAGQNVLYSQGSVVWQVTPYAGMNNDQIYTTRGQSLPSGATQPTTSPATQPGNASGIFDLNALPFQEDDSFLLPVGP